MEPWAIVVEVLVEQVELCLEPPALTREMIRQRLLKPQLIDWIRFRGGLKRHGLEGATLSHVMLTCQETLILSECDDWADELLAQCHEPAVI